MKKLSLISLLLLAITLSSLAQTSLSVGANATGSMNVSYWGASAIIEAQYQLTSRLTAGLSLNGFHDLAPGDDQPGFEANDYHRSVYSNLGLNFKLIDQTVDWSIGAGGTYQIGSEQYIQSTSYRGDMLLDYSVEKNSFSRSGYFVKNTLGIGQRISFNITVYRFTYWGEYISLGPSFAIK